jgi:ferredoxin
MSKADALLEKLGLSLGPIGMTLGESKKPTGADVAEEFPDQSESLLNKAGKLMDDAGVSLGPIGMTLGAGEGGSKGLNSTSKSEGDITKGENKSIAGISTEEWRRKYVNRDGTVDLFMQDDFNKASRLAGGADFGSDLTNIENIAWTGLPSDSVTGVRHAVKVTDHVTGEVLTVEVPENRYVLFEAEQDGWELPNACRMGCCTKCAVKVTKGSLAQPEALGLSKKYRDEGYALLCVSTALSDVECVTQDEEEVYQMQFGELFQQLATDKNGGAVIRDDFALEIADMDE